MSTRFPFDVVKIICFYSVLGKEKSINDELEKCKVMAKDFFGIDDKSLWIMERIYENESKLECEKPLFMEIHTYVLADKIFKIPSSVNTLMITTKEFSTLIKKPEGSQSTLIKKPEGSQSTLRFNKDINKNEVYVHTFDFDMTCIPNTINTLIFREYIMEDKHKIADTGYYMDHLLNPNIDFYNLKKLESLIIHNSARLKIKKCPENLKQLFVVDTIPYPTTGFSYREPRILMGNPHYQRSYITLPGSLSPVIVYELNNTLISFDAKNESGIHFLANKDGIPESLGYINMRNISMEWYKRNFICEEEGDTYKMSIIDGYLKFEPDPKFIKKL